MLEIFSFLRFFVFSAVLATVFAILLVLPFETAQANWLQKDKDTTLNMHLLDADDIDSRLYYSYTPESYDPKAEQPYPALIVLHGGGGNALQTSNHVDMNSLADTENFVVLYPEGVGKKVLGKTFATWNAGSCCGQAQEDNIDDVAYIKSVLEHASAQYNIDTARIYATGMSNGGIMAHRLACEMSDSIAAIAAVGAPGVAPDCKPKRAVPVMIVHGTEDQCALFEGGDQCGGCWQKAMREGSILNPKDNHFPCMSVTAQEKVWRDINQCGVKQSVVFQQGDTMCRQTMDCKEASVMTCVIYGGGHTWPGAAERECKPRQKFCNAFKQISGKTSRDFHANKMMWHFFKTHRLRPID